MGRSFLDLSPDFVSLVKRECSTDPSAEFGLRSLSALVTTWSIPSESIVMTSLTESGNCRRDDDEAVALWGCTHEDLKLGDVKARAWSGRRRRLATT